MAAHIIHRSFPNLYSLLFSRTMMRPVFLVLLFSLTSICTAFAQTPVAYYPFNGDAQDASGNNLHGTVRGAVLTTDRFGRCNSAYAFDATEQDFIEVPHSSLLGFGQNDFSVVAWVKFCAEQPDYAGIVCKGPVLLDYPGYQLQIGNIDKILVQVGTVNETGEERRGLQSLSDGEWHMLAMTVSSRLDSFAMYVDGVLVSQWQQVYPYRGTYSVSRHDPTPLFIGKERNSVRYFTGAIDDVRLFDRVLTPAEMMQLYRENGWNGQSQLNVEIIPSGPITICEGDSVVLSTRCFPELTWSTSETTSSIVVKSAGVYTVAADDLSSCGLVGNASVVVNVIRCGDSVLYDWNVGMNCVGRSQLLDVPLHVRQGGSQSVVRVEFLGPDAQDIEYLGPLPFDVRPTSTTSLPVFFRWTHEGKIRATMLLVTASGMEYKIGLEGLGKPSFSPIFDASEIRIGNRNLPFDTCITVTSVAPRGIVITDTTWIRTTRGFALTSPQLPLTVRPGESVRLCFRYTPSAGGGAEKVLLGGLEGVSFCPHCYQHELDLNTLSAQPIPGGLTSGIWSEAAGNDAGMAFDLYPNPSGAKATAGLTLDHSEDVHLLLFDMNGEAVGSLFNGRLEVGTHQISLDLQEIPSGMYTLRIVCGGRVQYRRLVIER